MQRSQSGFLGIARLIEALAPLPPLPSVIRYWDDFADCWKTIRNPTENVWSFEVNGEFLRFDFSSFDGELVHLMKLWLARSVSELACATVKIYFQALQRLDKCLIYTTLELSLMSDIVDVQLALPPWLNATDRWTAQSLIAIAYGRFQAPGGRVRTKYIFQVASGLMYSDDALVFPVNIQECTILYKMGDPPGFRQQPHLEPHQVQISALIERVLNAVTDVL